MPAVTIDRRWIVLAALALALVGSGGYLLGAHNTKQADWHTAVARVVGDRGHTVVTMSVDGWSYGFETGNDVAWVDRYGTVYDGSWPDCLAADQEGSRRVPIRFATGVVDTGYFGYRPVVMVDCAPADGLG